MSQQKRLVTKDSSTSNSDCDDIMSVYSDSDIDDYGTDDTIEANDFFKEIAKTKTSTKTGDKTDLLKVTEETELNTNSRNLAFSELTNTINDYECIDENEMAIGQDQLYTTSDGLPSTTADYELNHEFELVQDSSYYSVGDFVLVRYFPKKIWIYYVGIIQEIDKTDGRQKYTIVFFKTLKKPYLAFRKTRLIDRDIVDNLSIVKKISLKSSTYKQNELILAEESDMIYFE